MIEINLLPDVKTDLLRAQKVRSAVISITIIVGIVAVGIVTVLSIWVFAVQTTRGILSDNTIKSESRKLTSVSDLANTLTIQHQLGALTGLHEEKHLTSRAFDMLTTIIPAEPNNVAINTLTLNSDSKTIIIEAQAPNGYPSLEVFKKTILATNFQYVDNGEKKTVPLASGMSDGDRSYGEDSTGQKVLRFTLSFEYPAELFSPYLTNAIIAAPTKTNATDSYIGVPQSLFVQKVNDPKEGQ